MIPMTIAAMSSPIMVRRLPGRAAPRRTPVIWVTDCQSPGHRDHAPLVGADADRALALAHLDLEAQLALLDHLAQARDRDALGPLERAADVLDADLEADRRVVRRQVLVDERRGGGLHHRDHPRRRE